MRGARLGLLFVLVTVPGCPLAIETGYEIGEGSGGSVMANAGASGATSSAGGSLQGGSTQGGNAGTGGGAGGNPGTGGGAGTQGGSAGAQGGSAGAASGGAGAASGGASGNAGTAGTGDAGAGGGTPTCEESCADVCCGDACVDTMTSADHCGACGHVCPLGRSCSAGKCAGGWLEGALGDVTARSRAAHVWTGKHIFVWGGQGSGSTLLASGFLYDPRTGTTTAISTDENTPSARILPNAVWLESVGRVLVWGGSNLSTTFYDDGALYDPEEDAWYSIPDAPDLRRGAVGVWTGSQALFYGGTLNATTARSDVLLFTPSDPPTWTVALETNEPDRRTHFAWGWSGSLFYIFGGNNGSTYHDTAHAYAPAGDDWTDLDDGKGSHSGVFGAWTGSAFFTWGGRTSSAAVANGSLYSGTSWTPISGPGAPSARQALHRETGWTANIATGKVLILGGRGTSAGTYFSNGAVYDAAAMPPWTAVPAWPSGEDHAFGVGLWTGEEFVLLGGLDGTAPTNTIDRWAP